MIRLLVPDVEGRRRVFIPQGYRKCYRVPGTNLTMYCRWPFHGPLIVAHDIALYLLNLQAKFIWWRLGIQSWVMKFIFGKGKYL
jgi:hypothetical protein